MNKILRNLLGKWQKCCVLNFQIEEVLENSSVWIELLSWAVAELCWSTGVAHKVYDTVLKLPCLHLHYCIAGRRPDLQLRKVTRPMWKSLATYKGCSASSTWSRAKIPTSSNSPFNQDQLPRYTMSYWSIHMHDIVFSDWNTHHRWYSWSINWRSCTSNSPFSQDQLPRYNVILIGAQLKHTP